MLSGDVDPLLGGGELVPTMVSMGAGSKVMGQGTNYTCF